MRTSVLAAGHEVVPSVTITRPATQPLASAAVAAASGTNARPSRSARARILRKFEEIFACSHLSLKKVPAAVIFDKPVFRQSVNLVLARCPVFRRRSCREMSAVSPEWVGRCNTVCQRAFAFTLR